MVTLATPTRLRDAGTNKNANDCSLIGSRHLFDLAVWVGGNLLAARAHELAALDLSCALIKQDMCKFSIPIHVKNARPYHPPREIVLTKYQQDRAICVIQCVNNYLARTKGIRQGNHLLVSYIKPHKAISSQTVSTWLCTAIQQTGVDWSFKGHSTRAAATSEAAGSGIPLELVLYAVDWSSARTFEHYHKVHVPRRFAQSVLSAHTNL